MRARLRMNDRLAPEVVGRKLRASDLVKLRLGAREPMCGIEQQKSAKTGPSAISVFDPLRKFRRCRARSLRTARVSLAKVAELERSELVQNRPDSPAEVRHASHRNEGSRL